MTVKCAGCLNGGLEQQENINGKIGDVQTKCGKGVGVMALMCEHLGSILSTA